MTITSIYAGASQCDIASLTVGGITYECYVWLTGATGAQGGTRVEAKVFALGEGGQRVLVDAAVVATSVGDFVDCPRVLAASSADDALFVIHWIDVNLNTEPDTASLHRSLFDMTDIAAGWDPQGSVAIHETLQYDHAEVVGSNDGGFVVARRTAADAITLTRYIPPFTWADTDWSTTITGLTIDDTILGCDAFEADDVVLVSYQSGLTLRTITRTASGGGAIGHQEVLGTFDDSTEHVYSLVRHERFATNTYLLQAESRPGAFSSGYESYLRRVIARVVGRTAAPAYQPQWLWNVGLHSTWTWAGGTTGQTEVYACVTFKSIADGQEFDQMFAYLVRWDVQAFATASVGTLRPIPVSAIMGGSFDSRPHGESPYTAANLSIGARLNHSSRTVGPPQYTLGLANKSKTFACTRWGRLKAVSDDPGELHPVEAGIGHVTFYPEPPWTVRRDGGEPTQPDTPAWSGVSKAHCLPVETPPGLVLTGGVTQAYDGEQLVELGYLWNPEIVDIQVTAMGGANDMDGLEYHWFVNWIWPDNRGGTHRSGPSRPVSVTLADGEFATLTVRCMNLTLKDDRSRYPTSAPIAVEVWRTYAVGGALVEDSVGVYLFRSEYGENDPTSAFEIRDTPNSDPSAPTIDIIVGRANSLVDGNQLAPYQLALDTLQWVPPPPVPHQPAAVACYWQNRLFTWDRENRCIAWSEEILPLGNRYEWPRFLDTSTFRLDGVGNVTAMEPMDSALVVYTRDAIFALTGDPGAGGSVPQMSLQTITTGLGCKEPRSVVSFPGGQMFQAEKGIHLLSRGQGIDHAGAPIEDLVRAAGNVRGAVHLRDTHQLAFPLQAQPGTGPLTVRPRVAFFDYRVGKWATRTLPMLAQSSTASRLNETAHAIAWRGRQGETSLVVLEQGGLGIQRSRHDTVYADVGASSTSSVCLDVTTEWFHPAGIVGQWLCDEIGIQTERLNVGPLTIEVWANVDGRFDGSYNAANPIQRYTYAGVAGAPAYIAVRQLPFLCMSWVKVRIFEPASAPATENVRLVSLSLSWRHVPGHRKAARV